MKRNPLTNQRGQGLIEYVILVAIIAIGSIVVVRAVGQNLNVKFGHIVTALGGTIEGGRPQADTVSSSAFKKKDLKNFMQGAVSRSPSAPDNDDP